MRTISLVVFTLACLAIASAQGPLLLGGAAGFGLGSALGAGGLGAAGHGLGLGLGLGAGAVLGSRLVHGLGHHYGGYGYRGYRFKRSPVPPLVHHVVPAVHVVPTVHVAHVAPVVHHYGWGWPAATSYVHRADRYGWGW